MEELPQELMFNIYNRLDAKDAGRSRTVSRELNRALTDPEFVKLWTSSRISSRPHHIIFSFPNQRCQFEDNVRIENMTLSPIPFHVEGSSKGVVGGFGEGAHTYVICNPTIRKTLTIEYPQKFDAGIVTFGVSSDLIPKLIAVMEEEGLAYVWNIDEGELATILHLPTGISEWLDALVTDDYNYWLVSTEVGNMIVSLSHNTLEWQIIQIPGNNEDTAMFAVNGNLGVVVVEANNTKHAWEWEGEAFHHLLQTPETIVAFTKAKSPVIVSAADVFVYDGEVDVDEGDDWRQITVLQPGLNDRNVILDVRLVDINIVPYRESLALMDRAEAESY